VALTGPDVRRAGTLAGEITFRLARLRAMAGGVGFTST
jgi:hypothetical protein